MKKEIICLVWVYVLNSILLLIYFIPKWLIRLYSIDNAEAQVIFRFLEYVITIWSTICIRKIRKDANNSIRILSFTAIVFLIFRFFVGTIASHDAIEIISKNLVNN